MTLLGNLLNSPSFVIWQIQILQWHLFLYISFLYHFSQNLQALIGCVYFIDSENIHKYQSNKDEAWFENVQDISGSTDGSTPSVTPLHPARPPSPSPPISPRTILSLPATIRSKYWQTLKVNGITTCLSTSTGLSSKCIYTFTFSI